MPHSFRHNVRGMLAFHSFCFRSPKLTHLWTVHKQRSVPASMTEVSLLPLEEPELQSPQAFASHPKMRSPFPPNWRYVPVLLSSLIRELGFSFLAKQKRSATLVNTVVFLPTALRCGTHTLFSFKGTLQIFSHTLSRVERGEMFMKGIECLCFQKLYISLHSYVSSPSFWRYTPRILPAFGGNESLSLRATLAYHRVCTLCDLMCSACRAGNPYPPSVGREQRLFACA